MTGAHVTGDMGHFRPAFWGQKSSGVDSDGLPSFGVTRNHRYYAIIRLPRSIWPPPFTAFVQPYSFFGEIRGSPELPLALCIACLAHRPRGSSRTLTIPCSRVLTSGASIPSSCAFVYFRGSITFRPTT